LSEKKNKDDVERHVQLKDGVESSSSFVMKGGRTSAESSDDTEGHRSEDEKND
jgi:hypothetical protein